MTAQVAADLRAAAEVLRRDGWTQGTYSNATGQWCVLGAVNVVTRDRVGDGNSSYLALSRWTVSISGQPPSHWNDAPGRTADEVIAALEAAADAAEADQ